MKIKEKPADFIVKEKLKLPLGTGHYAYFLLKKINWNTMDAIKEIAEKLNISESRIHYGGIKDKQALTEQHISIEHGYKQMENTVITDMELVYLGEGAERIHTGMLEGNAFEITVREIDSGANVIKHMPNYFDDQTFGIENTNAKVGKALVQKNFKEACEILSLDVEENNYIGALQKHGRILKLYLHSYQSKIFNNILSEYIKIKYKYKLLECGYEQLAFPTEEVKDTIKIPLINFDAELEGEIAEIAKAVLEKEGITERDFLIRPMPDLVSQTEYRDGFAEIKNLELSELKDKTQKAKFWLQKGSYATVAIKALFLHNI